MKLIKQFFHDRLVWTTICSIVLMILVHTVFTDTQYDGMYPDQFMAVKTTWHHCADWVIIGDSRTYVSVSPQGIATVIPDRRIVNYGFSGNCYSPEYFAAIESVLDPASSSPAILIGINPYGFTVLSQQQNGFQDTREKSQSLSHQLDLHLQPLLTRCQPLPIIERLSTWLQNNPLPSYTSECFPDGWQAFDRQPRDPELLLHNGYLQDLYRDNPIDNELLNHFYNQVRRWHNSGITVYAFRPPTEPKTLALERELSGFDDDEFIRQFESAGGIWLDLPDVHETWGNQTYDGHHLPRPLASSYSRQLAQKILEQQ